MNLWSKGEGWNESMHGVKENDGMNQWSKGEGWNDLSME